MTFYQELVEVAQKNIDRNKDPVVVGISVFAKQENGLYSMYLPVQWSSHTYDFSKGLYCVVKNVEKFHLCRSSHCEEMFLLKVNTDQNTGFWMPIFPKTFSWMLNPELVETRFEDTPKIYFEGNTEAIILKDFYYLHHSYMVLIDNKNYLIFNDNMCVYGEKINVRLTEFNYVKAIPNYNEFMVKDEKGEYFCCPYLCRVHFGPSACIEEMQVDDYPVLNEHYNGYFLKDESNNILGIYIAADCDYCNYTYTYKITLNNPAKAFKFLKRVIIKDAQDKFLKDKFLHEIVAEVWGITYVNGSKDVIVQITGYNTKLMQYSINHSDLVF